MQDDRRTHYLYLGEQSLGQQCENQEDETLLLLTDPNNSVLGECQQDTLRTAVYSAYGNRHSDEPLLTTLGFNGEVRDASSGWYLLGRGYRAYNPVLMRFHSPDSLSPFAAGGVNPYTYCWVTLSPCATPLATMPAFKAVACGGRMRASCIRGRRVAEE